MKILEKLTEKSLEVQAKFSICEYYFFGPVSGFYSKDLAYEFITAEELRKEPLNIKDPKDLAAIAITIAEIEKCRHNWIRGPIIPLTEEEAQKIVKRRIDEKVAMSAAYFGRKPEKLHEMLSTLEKYQKERLSRR